MTTTEKMRAAFKYWKRRKPPPDFSNALDLHVDENSQEVIKVNVCEDFDLESSLEKYGMKPSKDWKAFALKSNDGLVYIKNPFLPFGQKYWIVRCLRDYTKRPFKLNIDAHGYLNADDDWWTESHSEDTEKNDRLIKSLRWSTLGYHHDWDAKIYTEDNRDLFPDDLNEMCKVIALLFGFEDYAAQASIVNFYHMDSTLSPHTDHSEKNLDAPLISISFGQSAIFLIGNENDDVTALHLHSGDIVIMSKKSRLSCHAVPKIVQTIHKPWNTPSNDSNRKNQIKLMQDLNTSDIWEPFEDYIGSNRININVRQVLFRNQNTLNDKS